MMDPAFTSAVKLKGSGWEKVGAKFVCKCGSAKLGCQYVCDDCFKAAPEDIRLNRVALYQFATGRKRG